jgi:hypothetical protein
LIVLDIDLDFFLSGIATRQAPRGKRLAEDLIPWSEFELRSFLERQCGLTRSRPIPGAFLQEHDGVFKEWRKLILANRLSIPFDVVHVDAHADLGMGDGSWHYISTDLLHRHERDRINPIEGGPNGLNQGNFVLFAIACRWIRELTYVYHPDCKIGTSLRDIPPTAMKNFDVDCQTIQPKQLNSLTPLGTRPVDCEIVGLEPEVPLHSVAGKDFMASADFDFMFLTRSPRYTPAAADALIPLITQYMAME